MVIEALTLPNDAVTLKNEYIENSYKMKYIDYSKTEKKYFVSVSEDIKLMTKSKKSAKFYYNQL